MSRRGYLVGDRVRRTAAAYAQPYDAGEEGKVKGPAHDGRLWVLWPSGLTVEDREDVEPAPKDG